eukprot:4909050-Amphidinium_carterae.1
MSPRTPAETRPRKVLVTCPRKTCETCFVPGSRRDRKGHHQLHGRAPRRQKEEPRVHCEGSAAHVHY